MWKRVQLKDGDPIAGSSKLAEHIYAVIEGSVRVLETTGDSKLLSKGSVFGEACLIRSTPSHTSIYAEGDVLLSAIHKDHFLQSFETNPKAARKVVKTLLKRMQEMDDINAAPEQVSEPTEASSNESQETQGFDPNTTHGRIMQMTTRRSHERFPMLTGISSALTK